jgi:hypothetical protein
MTKLAQPDLVRPGTRNQRGVRRGSATAMAAVAITERALDALVALRTAEHALPGQALGLVVSPRGAISLVLDLPGAHDQVFSRNDTPIFFVDPDVGARCQGRLLDHAGPLGHEAFTFDYPHLDEPALTSTPRRP